jgi:hypothetical protein
MVMNLLSQYKEMLNFVEININGKKVTTDKTSVKVAATLLNVTIDHAQGIYHLLDKGVYPSASALLRVIFETYIRAMWLEKCATDEQIVTFIEDDKILNEKKRAIHFSTMVSDVEEKYELPPYFTEIQKNTWSGLNSLTHGGMIQLHRYFDGKTIQHRYNDELINEAIQFSTFITCMAFAAFIDLSDDKDDSVTEELFKLIELWAFNKSLQPTAAPQVE